MNIVEFKKIKAAEWTELVDFEDAKKEHAKNIKNCRAAVEDYEKTDRPLNIFVVHGSGRSSNRSCAYEASNSALYLDRCLKDVLKDHEEIKIDTVNLRDYNIEPCNGCVSTCSALCNFPCTCFPFDPMQELYPKILRSDILLCSTPVNQSTMSTRLKAFCDRLISLDGGFFIKEDQFAYKDGEYKAKMMKISASTDNAYDQRLFGRVGAYFVSSKDQANPHDVANHTPDKKFEEIGYADLTAYTLKDGFESYGYFHADNYWAAVVANSDIDYMYDKDTMNQDTKAFENGRSVIRDAIKLAEKLRKDPPVFKTDRYNRT